VQAAVLADAGHGVCCVDIDETQIENLKKDVVPFFEPGLTPLVEKSCLRSADLSRMQNLVLSLANYNLLPWALPQIKMVRPILNTF
jgi:UDP-glucose 6-dehydrogenase